MMSSPLQLQTALELEGKDIFCQGRDGGVYDRTVKRGRIYLSFVSYLSCWLAIMEADEARKGNYSKKECFNGKPEKGNY